ncbi:ABC transporter ATP-binding protein [Natronospora cellulosivora (SeqCode)]
MAHRKKVAIIETFLSLLNIGGYIIIILLLTHYLRNGSITVGMFAAVYYSVAKIHNLSNQLMSKLGVILKDVSLAVYLYELLDTNEKEGVEKTLEVDKDIKLKNVSFKYPGAKDKVLKNINLNIKAGETLAIVGENGAGKTTLTKIILGLYSPIEGSVYTGNKDISDYNKKSRFKYVSAVFQKFQHYKMTLKNNIRISDMYSTGDMQQIIKEAGVNLNTQNLDNGIDTMLSREFNGSDLSGGQWQRVAIARGLFKIHDLIVLDEPTSAIDPLAESELYNKFAKLAREKTTILVTHRLASIKIADKIIVLDKGKIIEKGKHKTLIAQKGVYHNMFQEQSKWYIRE